jgi:hypothetical protein
VRRLTRLVLPLALATGLAATMLPAGAAHNADQHVNMRMLFNSPNDRGTKCFTGAGNPTPCTNSDIAFWGNMAVQGDYGGFRLFDISNPASPSVISSFDCFGPQNDPVLWKNILALAVDAPLTGPACGSTPNIPANNPGGWEGVRLFDVSDPANPKFIKGVYSDCGAHTITAWPKSKDEIVLWVSSYPLGPGPTCGDTEGPAAGRDPNHGVIQVINVPLNNPSAAAEIAEPKIVYPGDPDNRFTPAEHGLPGPPALEPSMRACHDITTFVPLRIAGAACAEQAQLWRVGPDGMPDTQNPIWVYDDTVDETGTTGDTADKGVVVDFFHSFTFSWDGKIANVIDESFGSGCPPTTSVGATVPNRQPGDTGRMFFLDVATGRLLSSFMAQRPGETVYCSAHLGNTVAAHDKYLLANAWYHGGADVIDFTDPANPDEVAFYDAAPFGAQGSENWSVYWYEGPALPGQNLTLYGTDGLAPSPNRGFQVFRAGVAAQEVIVQRMNPQTQEFTLPARCARKLVTHVGTPDDDVINGRTAADRMLSYDGNDRLSGRGGKDRLCGSRDNDRLRGGAKRDRLVGGPGNDRLNGGPGRDVCIGGPGRDRARGCEVTRSIP